MKINKGADACRVGKVVSIGTVDYWAYVETYKRLAQEPFPGYENKHLIVVRKLVPSNPIPNGSIEIVGALQDIKDWSDKDPKFSYFPTFTSVNDPNYLTSRAVFSGTKGLKLADSILSNISYIELKAGIAHYLVHVFTPTIVLELNAIIFNKETWSTITIAEIEVSLDYYKHARPPFFYTWSGIIFKLKMVLINNDGNSHVVYEEVGRHQN